MFIVLIESGVLDKQSVNHFTLRLFKTISEFSDSDVEESKQKRSENSNGKL